MTNQNVAYKVIASQGYYGTTYPLVSYGAEEDGGNDTFVLGVGVLTKNGVDCPINWADGGAGVVTQIVNALDYQGPGDTDCVDAGDCTIIADDAGNVTVTIPPAVLGSAVSVRDDLRRLRRRSPGDAPDDQSRRPIAPGLRFALRARTFVAIFRPGSDPGHLRPDARNSICVESISRALRKQLRRSGARCCSQLFQRAVLRPLLRPPPRRVEVGLLHKAVARDFHERGPGYAQDLAALLTGREPEDDLVRAR